MNSFAALYSGQVSRARAARVPLLFVATLQSVGILLLLRGVVDQTSDTTAQQVVAGSTVLVVAFVALNLLAQRFGALRASGALDHYATLPVSGAAVVGALVYGLPLGHLWLLVVVLPLAGAGLAGLGASLGLLAPRPELATVLGQLGMSGVLFVGIIPAARLPEVLRAVRAAVPSTYAVDALAASFRARWDTALIARDLGICAAVAVAALALASAAFRRAVRA